ncbi:MAG: glycosyltransferase [Oscillospiraceae bacterium]|jgi:glycosyltransferase involved in cell wall biosynthesis|nr:glycosyltransferase [Oscillospiraceae bacterium]
MHNDIRCSVLLAAYCGEQYLPAQLDSILPQLGDADELLLSDDSPPDCPATRALAEAYAARDARIRVLQGPRQGVIRNVEFLLGQARGQCILLSDQDDVWLPGKLEALFDVLAEGALLAVHDAVLTDADLQVQERSLFALRHVKPGALQNILRNGYTGCCMALRRELLPLALPFPQGIPMHDQWLGLLAQCSGKVAWLPEPLLLHRRLASSLTARGGSFAQKLRWRTTLLAALARRLMKVKKNTNKKSSTE